ncbi:MAG: GDSL-type esterase/lipase family protein [Polyangiales bacterium]
MGDSIAGYGARGPDGHCEYDATLNDASLSWVSLAADDLGAEVEIIAGRAAAFTRNYDAETRETLVDVCDRAIPTERDHRPDLRGYDPDDVVLNVGTNDAARPGFDAARFRDALGGFVASLARRYRRARFVLAVGPILNDDVPTAGCRSLALVRAATASVVEQTRASGRRVELLELTPATSVDCCGCGGHPSRRTHRRMADALLSVLRAR